MGIKIKLSDYVAEYIAKKKVKTVFAISGGASLHLIHSVNDHPNLNLVCTHHEQASAMAADAYSRVTGNLGVAITTSGPGATNLITGICCSYYDSVPMLIITGQVSTTRMTGDTGVRQIGFQETPITEITKTITKYSKTLKSPNDILYELEKATSIAVDGRPGPVLIDIPDNLQREIIDVDNLNKFSKSDLINSHRIYPDTKDSLEKFLNLLNKSQRPVVIAGWGIHLSKTEKKFIEFINRLSIPVALTWGASDLISAEDDLYIGTFGTHGMRHANFAVQNADLIISLGSRLDTKSTGSPISTFAREAKKIMVDIDPNELGKFKSFDLFLDLLIQDDLKDFFENFKNFTENYDFTKFLYKNNNWLNTISNWEKLFNENKNQKVISDGKINPYDFFKVLSNNFDKESLIFIDTGCSIAWAMQIFNLKEGIRVFHDFNNTAMGWALPATIGGHFADPKKNLISIVGDGSFMMSLQELATVMHHQIKIKLIIINNEGYSMIKQTQEQWLDSKYVASSNKGDLSFPDYKKVAQSFKLDYFELKENNTSMINTFLSSPNASLMNVIISPEARVNPQVKFGRPNEDMEPLLSRDIFLKSMIIKPLQSSLEN